MAPTTVGLAALTVSLVIALALIAPASSQVSKEPKADSGAEGSPESEATLEPSTGPAQRAEEGKKFPALKLQVLLPGSTKLAPLDLATDIGVRPVVFVYFLMEYRISEDILAEVRDFVKSDVKGKVALYPVVRLGRSQPITELVERMKLLGIEEPVIVDEDGIVQKTLGVGIVPGISLIDRKGVFCFTRANSLRQPILGEIDLRESIRMASRGEDPPVVFGLLRYYLASDFIGEKFKDFTLPDALTGDGLRLYDHVTPGRLTAIFYWDARSQLSNLVMPLVTAAFRTYHPKYLDVVSIVRMKSGESKEEVAKYASAAGIAFPVLADKNNRFTTLYRVDSTPTLILIRPDGVVDSVYTSGRVNFFTILQTKIDNLVVRPAMPVEKPAPPS